MPPRKRIAARFGPGGERVVIEDPEALKVLYDPLRFKIVGLLGEGRTAKEIADEIDRPLTSLYYHLNVLVEHGLVKVEEERIKGRSVERLFRRVADEFAADADMATVVGGILDRRGGLASAVDHLRRAFQPDQEDTPHRGTRMVMDMCFTSSDEEAQRVMEHIRRAVDENVHAVEEGEGPQRRFRLVVAISEAEGEDNDETTMAVVKKRRR